MFLAQTEDYLFKPISTIATNEYKFSKFTTRYFKLAPGQK